MDEAKFTLILPLSMIQTIGVALENAPYKVAAPVLVELQRQINAQQQEPNAPQPATPANDSDRPSVTN